MCVCVCVVFFVYMCDCVCMCMSVCWCVFMCGYTWLIAVCLHLYHLLRVIKIILVVFRFSAFLFE